MPQWLRTPGGHAALPESGNTGQRPCERKSGSSFGRGRFGRRRHTCEPIQARYLVEWPTRLKRDRTGSRTRQVQRRDAIHRNKAVERHVLARPAIVSSPILLMHPVGFRLLHFRAVHGGHPALRDSRGMRCDLYEQAQAHAQQGKGAKDTHLASIPAAISAIKLACIHRRWTWAFPRSHRASRTAAQRKPSRQVWSGFTRAPLPGNSGADSRSAKQLRRSVHDFPVRSRRFECRASATKTRSISSSLL